MRHVSRIGIMVLAATIGAIAIAAGCSNAPLRTEKSTSGIRAAQEVGAAQVPQASLHLQLAREELAQAQGLSKEGEKEQAESLLMRAEADAELAVALSRESTEKSEAQQAVERVRQLRQDNK
ncbi:MAG: DUF4398 domain-containing protein [Deltaproteobacteria bacterium]|nr:DUF4398 domain-containing protein [Deltaproteobacteria bacterium]